MSFTHLHVHSHYSLLDGLTKIPDLVKHAKNLGYTALALTDHGAMYGAIEFYKSCRKEGIKPIIGMEAYIAPRSLYLKQPKVDSQNFHLTLLAKNQIGYKNLMSLSTIGHIDGFYYRPRLDRETLKKYSAGLICLSGCAKGELRSAIRSGNLDQARQIINDYKEIFDENYYLEIQNLIMTGNERFTAEQAHETDVLKGLSAETGVKLVATCDVHYLTESDAETQDIVVCIQTGKEVSDKNRLDMRYIDLSLYPPDKINKLFAETPEAVKNAGLIADQCKLELDLATWHYPAFDTPQGKTDEGYLRELVLAGAKERYGQPSTEVKKRIEYELDIINYKKYSSYFLIFADFMNWARRRGILTTARGSVSGSVVSYCLHITNIDPLVYKVPFERFLTKERPSPPDIDADIADDHRDEVIDYVRHKYGEDRVAQICTFGTMMARGSFRDVARVLGKPAAWADRFAKMIPFGTQGFPMTLAKALKESADLAASYHSDSEVKRVYDIARHIEGCARHVSVHAAGVVVTPTKLTDFIPLQVEPKGRNIITQYDMYDLDPNSSKESVGVLKLDFLGLRNLSILGRAVSIVKKTKGQEVDIYKVPLDDKKTYDMLSNGLTFGVFQLASSGMTRYIKELKPTQVSDLMAMVALYRPGPIENIPEFIKRKNNPSLIAYPDQRLKEVLEMSYGLLVYQDDVLYTVIILAGYKPSEADAFRKAVGKKKPGEMEAQKAKFYQGCMDNGLDKKKVDEIWKLIEPFAAYGFNKAHASSYGMLAYQTAYMKANYPAEYMTALMTCEAGNADKIAEAVKECLGLKITVSPPDVNASRDDFTFISDKEIRFGLSAIKNLGSDIIQAIIRERKAKGPYKSLQDFLIRVESKNLNKKSIESLIKAGALDTLEDRGKMYANLEKILSFSRYAHQDKNTQQASLFGESVTQKIELVLDDLPGPSNKEKLTWEKELLGLFVSDHPFKNIQASLPPGTTSLSEVIQTEGQTVFTAALVTKVQQVLTKRGELMVFASLEDMTGQIEGIVFPSVYKAEAANWVANQPLLIHGRMSSRNGENKLIIEQSKIISGEVAPTEILNLEQKNTNPNKPAVLKGGIMVITVPSRANSRDMQSLKILFSENPGPYVVHLEIRDNGSSKKIKTKYQVSINPSVIGHIEKITGPGTTNVEEKK